MYSFPFRWEEEGTDLVRHRQYREAKGTIRNEERLRWNYVLGPLFRLRWLEFSCICGHRTVRWT